MKNKRWRNRYEGSKSKQKNMKLKNIKTLEKITSYHYALVGRSFFSWRHKKKKNTDKFDSNYNKKKIKTITKTFLVIRKI